METVKTMLGAGATANPNSSTTPSFGDNLGTGLSLVGTGIKVGSQIGSGQAAKQAADFEAAQYRQRAALDVAAAQRQGFERADATSRVLGETKAVAAASGGGVATPTISDIIGDIAAKGNYQQRAELYKGQVAAENDLNSAAAATMRGKNALKGSILEGIGTGLTGASKFLPRSGLLASVKTPTTDDSGDQSLLSSDDDYQTGWKTRTRSFG